MLLLIIFFLANIGLMWKNLHLYDSIKYLELTSFAFQKEKNIQQKKRLGFIWKFNYKNRKICHSEKINMTRIKYMHMKNVGYNDISYTEDPNKYKVYTEQEEK